MPEKPVIQPPIADQHPVITEHFGHRLLDNYAWLRDKKSAATKAYLKAENRYAQAVMRPAAGLRRKLYQEFRSRIKETDESVPYRFKGYLWYLRTEEGKDFPIYCRRKEEPDAIEEIYFDENQYNVKLKSYTAAPFEWSPSLAYLAYAIDQSGNFETDVYFLDMKTGETLKDVLKDVSSLVFCDDERTIYYTVNDSSTNRSYRLLKHVLGSPPSMDELIYEERDPSFELSVYRSRSDRHIFQERSASSAMRSEILFTRADDVQAGFQMVHARETEAHWYSMDDNGKEFFILSDKNAANFCLMHCPLDQFGIAHWKAFLPYKEDVYLDDFEIMNDHLVISEKVRAQMQFRVVRITDRDEYLIPVSEPCYSLSAATNPEMGSSVFRYYYQSFTQSASCYDFDLRTRERVMLKQSFAGLDYHPEDYASERIWMKGRDGVQVPVSLVYKKTLFKKDGTNPLWLYAYGAYGIPSDVHFSPARRSLLDRGFVFAIAHVRGGNELGMAWYENGKMMKKLNSFYDFIDVSEGLIAEGYTYPTGILAEGGSAGGLLVAAVMNMRPDLYKGVLLEVPFVDVINSMSDESLPLTGSEWKEWGNPKVKEEFEYMLQYSPYENVKAGNYPAMLFVSGFADEQVGIWEPAKMVARLRQLKTDASELLFKVEFKGGHWGPAGRYARLKEEAFHYAWALRLFGIKN